MVFLGIPSFFIFGRDMMGFSNLPVGIIDRLSSIGIMDINDLIRVGSVEVFLLLKKSGMTISNSILWSLDSLVRGISFYEVDDIRKEELLGIIRGYHPVDIFPDISIMNGYMGEALHEAKRGLIEQEVPVGAVITYNNAVISRGYNQTIYKNGVDNHAEMVAIRGACERLGTYRLNDCDIYVTLEPCIMCSGAIINSRIRRLIFGLEDYKTGSVGSVINIFRDSRLNKFTSVLSGVRRDDSKGLLQDFFLKLR